jgi:RNA polymerase sigma factor (sigma-70 family)
MKVVPIEKEEKDEQKRSYEYEYKMNARYILRKSDDMSLEEILNKIKEDKNFIFNFIKQPQIEKITNSIRSMWKFNKDEVEDAIIFVITEYFYENQIDMVNFNEELFLTEFMSEIRNRVKKQMREGYSEKERVSSDWNVYEDFEMPPFEDDIITMVDFINSMKDLSSRDKNVLELYYINNYTIREISNIIKLSKSEINRIILKAKDGIKIFNK